MPLQSFAMGSQGTPAMLRDPSPETSGVPLQPGWPSVPYVLVPAMLTSLSRRTSPGRSIRPVGCGETYGSANSAVRRL
ncbi:MAG TPA: hypothetical protein VGR62_06575 [Candidatus Binatia bacterium]|jgi:hypothetical protein|nr:hypothetical protein [Candidatus Binatia bacterium]